MENKPKFAIGDRVKIVRYGHPMFASKKSGIDLRLPIISEDENMICYDMEPAIVGLQGTVSKVTETQGNFNYALEGVSKHAWYNEGQLELV